MDLLYKEILEMKSNRLGILGLSALMLGTSVSTMAEVPAKPTFTKDVLPILQENCQTCHRRKSVV